MRSRKGPKAGGHVKPLYLESREGKAGAREAIDLHLRECGDCRKYFEAMDRLLDPGLLRGIPELSPDSSLPDRIAALSAARKTLATGARREDIQFLFQGAAFAAAIVIGVLLGTIVFDESAEASDDEIATLYREAVGHDDDALRLDAVLDESEGRQE